MKTTTVWLTRLTICRGLLLAALVAPASAQTDYSTPYYFITLAGAASIGSTDGPGSAARFSHPDGVAVDPAGNLYVADTENNTIRKITPAGVVSTLAGKPGLAGSTDGTGGAARFWGPEGLAVDGAGNVYVADTNNNAIRTITPAGTVSTVAGLPVFPGYGSSDGTGSAARFAGPASAAVDGAGNVYIADTWNCTIRRTTAAGVVTTLAGTAGSYGSTDGMGSAARFYNPSGVAVDSAGNIYVADTSNNTIRKITPAGVVTTIAGTAGTSGSTDGLGSVARFNDPSGVAVDGAGNVYVADTSNNTIRKITPAGAVTTIAGTARSYGSTDGTGSAAQFNQPIGIAVDAAGNVYVADASNNTIRKITPAGTVSTVAGLSVFLSNGTTDGTGSAARFDDPFGVAADGAGNVYVADEWNNTIRKITAAGVVTTIAGTAGISGAIDGMGSAARFSAPRGVAADTSGNVYVADASNNTIRKITAAGVVTTLAGMAGSYGSTDGTGSAARFNQPAGIAVDAAGNVYVADTNNNAIRKITAAGVVTTLARGFYHPFGVAVDSAGNAYVADTGNHTIRKITDTGVVTTIAGTAGTSGSTDGTGSAVRFDDPSGVAVDGAGNVYVADTGNQTIRKITAAGVVTTIAGTAVISGSTDGTGSAARFYDPIGVAVDSAGNVYVADTDNNTIRKGQLAGPPVITTQPQSQTVAPGSSVQFTVSAGGVPDPTYQWYVNGSPFSGATTSTLSFANARATDAGDYTVVVTNELGSVTSRAATLTISAATTGTSPANGGGAIDAWLVMALLALGILRCGWGTWIVVTGRGAAPRGFAPKRKQR